MSMRGREDSLDTMCFMKQGKLTILSTFNLKFKFSLFHFIGAFTFEFDQNVAVLIKAKKFITNYKRWSRFLGKYLGELYNVCAGVEVNNLFLV